MKIMKVTSEKQLQDAFHIRKKVFVEEQQVPMEIEIDEYENTSTHFVVYDNKEPIGAGRFRVVDGKGKIERICINSSVRGHGYGKSLMQAIEMHAKQQQINILILNAQLSAIPFYENLGYKIVSDEFMDAGIPHKSMVKEV